MREGGGGKGKGWDWIGGLNRGGRRGGMGEREGGRGMGEVDGWGGQWT